MELSTFVKMYARKFHRKYAVFTKHFRYNSNVSSINATLLADSAQLFGEEPASHSTSPRRQFLNNCTLSPSECGSWGQPFAWRWYVIARHRIIGHGWWLADSVRGV